jgi:hypothetical protein
MTPGDLQNRRRPDPCDLCGGRGILADHPCHACDAGAAYFVKLPPDPEAERIARELVAQLAANRGTYPGP